MSDDETDAAAELEDKESFYFDTEEVEDDKPRDFTFDLNGPTNTAGQNSNTPHVVDDEEDRQPTNLAAQLFAVITLAVMCHFLNSGNGKTRRYTSTVKELSSTSMCGMPPRERVAGHGGPRRPTTETRF